jgi:hypothetical protein
MAVLEQRWFRTHRQATIAKAQLATRESVEHVDVQARLDRAERLKDRIMQRIEAVEDTLLKESAPVLEIASHLDIPAKR